MAKVKNSKQAEVKITPELVQQVADKVYALLMRDIQLGRERKRPFGRRKDFRK